MKYFTGIINKIWPKKIRSQLILGIVIVHLLLMGIFVYDMTNRQKHFLKKQHLEQTESMVSEYGLNSKRYIISHDLDGLERLTLAQNNFPNLKYAMILSPDKEVLAHTKTNYIGTRPNDNISFGLKDTQQTQVLLENNSILDIASPVLQDNKIIGWARVGIGQEYIEENLLGILRQGILYMVIALIIGFFVAISVGNRLNKGLYSLINTTDKIKEGDRKLRVSPFQTFEISKLGVAFNQMLDEISANEKLLEMVLENLPVGVFILNENGKIRSANTASKEIWKDIRYVGVEGYGEYKAWFANTKQPVRSDEWGAAIALRTGNPVLNQEVEIECFDRSRKTILNSAIPLKNDVGIIIAAIAINVEITERKKAEAVILKTSHDIGERVKELTCLYFLTKLVTDPEKSLVDILQECVNIIPAAYQYPGVTTSRIIFGNQTFESPGFSSSVWKQDAFIMSNEGKIGLIEVFYTSHMPDEQEGPFLKEERLLINSIADIIGNAAERRQAEVAIKEQAETFKAIIENTKESIYLISPDCKIVQFNKTAQERIGGRGINLYIGIDFREILFPDMIDAFQSMFEDAIKGMSRTEELRAQLTGGGFSWFQIKTSPVYDPRGNHIGITVLAEGIDDRKKAEVELRESEEKFRSLVEQSLIGVYIMRDSKLLYINPGFEKISGYSKEQLVDKMSFEDFVHEDDLEMIQKNYSLRIEEKKGDSQYIFRGIKSDGSLLHLEVIVSMILYNGIPAMIGTLIDITYRVEEEMRIGKAVNEAQENERIQIGMELHDNVCQILVGSLLTVEFVKSNFTKNKELAIKQLENLKKYTNEGINELRRLSHQLTPSINTDETLKEKIGQLIQTMNAGHELNISIEVDEFQEELHNDIKIALYRILQEQLKNIVKYAKASFVLISIVQDHNNIHLKIKDNGKGFDTAIKKTGIGLENIKRRSYILGGETKIVSSPGNGCEVNISIPLN